MAEIKVVRAWGEGLAASVDSTEGEAVIAQRIGDRIDTDLHTVSVELSNGYTIVIGQPDSGREGDLACWLEKDGEPVEGGRMSRSEQFTFNIPS